MRTFHAIALAAVLPLAACGRHEPPAPPGAPAAPAAPAAPGAGDRVAVQPGDTALSRRIQEAMAKASDQLATANLPVGGRIHEGSRTDGAGKLLPKAEITPQGDFLIDGKAVPVDERQRALLLEHRTHLVAIAQAGIAVGMQGAELGMQGAALGMSAARAALKGAIGGNTEDAEKQLEDASKRIEAEGRRIEAEADRMICKHVPDLFASQQALAAALPAFVPYATLEESDVKDCGKDGKGAFAFDTGDASKTAQPDAGAKAAPAVDAAAEADAAAKDAATRQ